MLFQHGFKRFVFPAICMMAVSLAAGDKLAIVEPEGSKDIRPDEIRVFWSMLESAAGGGKYELITRSALKTMQTEIGLVEKSGLTELNSTQKARSGALKTVRYILVSRLGKIGRRYQATLMVMDASTGSFISGQRASVTVNSMDELADKLKSVLRDMGIGPSVRKYGRCVVLEPRFTDKNVSVYLANEVGIGLETELIRNGIKVQNLKNVSAILAKNNIQNLSAVEPSMYARVGDLLQVDYLIQTIFTRFSLRTEKRYIAATRTTGIRHLGDLDGVVRIIDCQTGNVKASIPFSRKIDFDDFDHDTSDWTAADYTRFLISGTMPAVYAEIVKKLK